MHEGQKDVGSNISFEVSKFWRQTNAAVNLRSNSFEGGVNYDVEWGYLDDKDCELCEKRNECKQNCKHRNRCKLYVMKIDEGVVKIKRTNVNEKLDRKSVV